MEAAEPSEFGTAAVHSAFTAGRAGPSTRHLVSSARRVGSAGGARGIQKQAPLSIRRPRPAAAKAAAGPARRAARSAAGLGRELRGSAQTANPDRLQPRPYPIPNTNRHLRAGDGGLGRLPAGAGEVVAPPTPARRRYGGGGRVGGAGGAGMMSAAASALFRAQHGLRRATIRPTALKSTLQRALKGQKNTAGRASLCHSYEEPGDIVGDVYNYVHNPPGPRD